LLTNFFRYINFAIGEFNGQTLGRRLPFMEVFVFIWPMLFVLVFAIICALLARRKDRYVVGWFVCGLFFSLIALIIIAFLPKAEIKRPPTYTSKYLAQTGLIAALYADITVILAPISYGPIQVRVSEALTVLPYLTPAAIPGLFVGCVVANIYGGLGIYDIIGGSLCTLVAAFLTFLASRAKKPIFAPVPPVLVNAFGVSLYLHFLFQLPYWLTVIYIAAGEIVACFIIGYPLLRIVLKKEKILRMLKT
jgi:uncharacterized membrane protein